MKKLSRAHVLAVRRVVFSVLLLYPMFVHSQTTNGLVEDSDQVAYDRFGHAVAMRDLVVPNETDRGSGGPTSCTAGWFNLVFTDNNEGFNDPTFGATYRDIACRVFSDLSVLIVPANDPTHCNHRRLVS